MRTNTTFTLVAMLTLVAGLTTAAAGRTLGLFGTPQAASDTALQFSTPTPAPSTVLSVDPSALREPPPQVPTIPPVYSEAEDLDEYEDEEEDEYEDEHEREDD